MGQTTCKRNLWLVEIQINSCKKFSVQKVFV